MSGDACDVLVLGGGAAGLFCAFTAGQRGLDVRVLERAERAGKKILMSGGGRCNFTHTGTGPGNFLSANPDFCRSALARYRPEQFVALVDRHGIAWHEKTPGQLFCDESSRQVVKLLLDECAAARVRVDLDCEVQQVERAGDGFVVRTDGGTLRSRKLVVATGGLSVPTLGGSGFGYELATQFGHAIVPTRAALVPLTLSGRPQEEWCELAGVSLPVTARCGSAEFSDALLVTHRGLSGPAVLQISSYWQPGERLQLDLVPHADAFAWLVARQRSAPAQELKTALGEVLPRRFAQRFCEVLAPSRPLGQVAHAELRTIAQKLHDWPVVPSGTEGWRTAEVTLGGVDTREISSSTFESQRVPGLHFVGEVLDVTGWLGGYNFQWAWASAHACAQALQRLSTPSAARRGRT
ncbi:MAG TPA: NAD(P)/FAD-dependent oxidoreductase [Candidatus Binatia bacterium]|nr:NAD(P)/FAD-dependent oxidoreductase [Candidatus Binatia bacterium]